MQANLAAVTFLCGIFTIYAFILDMKSVAIENNANLPIFFHRKSYGFYEITIVFTLVSLAFDLIGIVLLSLVLVQNFILCCSNCCNNSCCKKKWKFYIPISFFIGSALLSLSFHFQNVLIAWSTDPFYASRIALFYGIIIFCYFVCVKYTYSLPLKILRRNEKKEKDPQKSHEKEEKDPQKSHEKEEKDPQKSHEKEEKDPQKSHWNTCELVTVIISLIVTTSVCTGIILIVATFIIHVPINNSIEHSLTGISTLFNGAVILIGGYIAYIVGIKHFGNPFSLEDALKNAMNETQEDPFKNNSNENWEKLTEEKRMTEVMKGLIQHPVLSQKSTQTPSNPPTELSSNSPTHSSTSPTQLLSTSQTQLPSTSQTQLPSTSQTQLPSNSSTQEPPFNPPTEHPSDSVTQSDVMIIVNNNIPHSDEQSQNQPTPNQTST